ncbi:cyclic nucleotide-binding domain-containing protein [Leptolyngbya sp. NK1-12]|uniref:Cyclic nucleotide-binding domain-containing protein n=1 Tax=Leptolyngbya sp. NK1-12 TaxID=2547451 RepID=A0AA97AJ20_9CYAN|nr:cyclic nucleotide-binding domain-containing protein [Leptolyngbya sp. NK1-12]
MKKALYMLSEFSDRDFDWLMHAGKRKNVPAKEILIYEGEPTDAFYLVLQGTLAVSVEAMGGEEIARLGTGEIVGEMSFIDSRPPAATVKAVEDSLVWAIPRMKLAAKLLQDVEFACHFYHAIAVFLADRLRGTVSRLGYDKEHPPNDDESNVNPQVIDNLDLAKARLNWLLNRLRGS